MESADCGREGRVGGARLEVRRGGAGIAIGPLSEDMLSGECLTQVEDRAALTAATSLM